MPPERWSVLPFQAFLQNICPFFLLVFFSPDTPFLQIKQKKSPKTSFFKDQINSVLLHKFSTMSVRKVLLFTTDRTSIHKICRNYSTLFCFNQVTFLISTLQHKKRQVKERCSYGIFLDIPVKNLQNDDKKNGCHKHVQPEGVVNLGQL